MAGDWRTQWPDLPVVAAGMVGSRQGWREVPYVECPADPAAIAAGLWQIALTAGLVRRAYMPGV